MRRGTPASKVVDDGLIGQLVMASDAMEVRFAARALPIEDKR